MKKLIVSTGAGISAESGFAELFKIASEHIENDKTAGVSYMYVIIHSGPADIHANFFIFYIKFFLASGKRIIKLH